MIPDINTIKQRGVINDEEYVFLCAESVKQGRCFYCGTSENLKDVKKAYICNRCDMKIFIHGVWTVMYALKEWWKC